MKKIALPVFFVLCLALSFYSQQTFTINDLLAVSRVSDPQLSPDAHMVAYTVGVVDMAANRVVNQIYIVSVDGGNPRQIGSDKGSSSSPRWSPDGRRIAY